jgi:hypothetical protein
MTDDDAADEFDIPEYDSKCPYCGWDRADRLARWCGHLVTELTEWPSNYAGTEGGAFGDTADEFLKPLVDTAWSFVSTNTGNPQAVQSLDPARLRPVVEALAEFGEPYEPDVEGDEVKSALGDYVQAVFLAACPDGQSGVYDTGDHYGTEALLLWSPDAVQAAQDMARLIAQDVDRLQAVQGQERPKRGKGPRSRGR